ncbi:MAG: response regulator transcription factor [Armatimonadetes bacterium]|nr:response regulator transcription factor [Armatimonadota bacterium]
MGARILLIEDEAPIAESVAYSLKSEGFTVEIAPDGLVGLSAFRTFSPDLIILDLMLPKLNGLDLCRIVRKESNIPIIMLTAKTEEVDRIVGLELGADDYVPKPFSTRELAARVRAVLRRTETLKDEEQRANMKLGAIEMDVARRMVKVDGQAIHLPLKQFELLRVMMMNQGKVLSREELFRKVWDEDATYDTGSLDVHVRWLRERIEADPSHPRFIRTVRGIGYKIVNGED